MPGANEDVTAPAGARGQVFLSYSRNDNLAFADQLAKGLETYGQFGVLLDRHSIVGGEAWEARTTHLIQTADTVVFALSPESVNSHFCKWEIDVATQAGKRLLTVVNHMIDDNTVPAPLRPINRIYFYSDPKIPGSGFVSGLTALIDALSIDLEWIREHSVIADAAARWDANGRDNSDLYSGGRLTKALAWRSSRPANAPEVTRLQNVFLDASEAAQRVKDNGARRLLMRIGAAIVAGIVVFSGLLIATVLSASRNADTNGILFAELAQSALEDDQHAAAMRWALAGLHQGSSESTLGARLSAIRMGEAHRLQALKRIWKETDSKFPIANIAVSADGSKLAVVTGSRVRILDGNTLSPTAFDVKVEDSPESDGLLVEFSPKAERLLIARPTSGVWARVYDTRSSKVIARLQLDDTGFIQCAEFSPDGKFVLTADLGGTATVWNATSGASQLELSRHLDLAHIKESDQLNCASYSPDGNSIFTSGSDGFVKLWEVKSGNLLWSLSTGYHITDATMSADGKYLVTSGRNGAFTFFEVETQEAYTEIAAHNASIKQIEFSPDGAALTTLSVDGSVKLWSVNSATNDDPDNEIAKLQLQRLGALRQTIKSENGLLHSAKFSDEGNLLIVADADSIQFWSTRVWDAEQKFVMTSPQGAAFSQDGSWFVAFGGVEPASILEITPQGLKRRALLQGAEKTLADVKISADGKVAITGSSGAGFAAFDTRSGKLIRRFSAPFIHYKAFAVSGDGARFLAQSIKKEIVVYSVRTGEVISRFRGHDASAQFAHFLDSNTVISATLQGQVLTWRVSDGSQVVPPLLTTGGLDSMAVSSDGEMLALGDQQGSVQVWIFEKWNQYWSQKWNQKGHADIVRAMQFSPDGRSLLSSSSDNSAKVWDVATGQLRSTLPHDGAVGSVAWYRHGVKAMTQGEDGNILQWDLRAHFEGTQLQRNQKACDALQKLGVRSFTLDELARPILRARPLWDSDPCTQKGPSTVGWWLGQ